jgi:hypothetical protein
VCVIAREVRARGKDNGSVRRKRRRSHKGSKLCCGHVGWVCIAKAKGVLSELRADQ